MRNILDFILLECPEGELESRLIISPTSTGVGFLDSSNARVSYSSIFEKVNKITKSIVTEQDYEAEAPKSSTRSMTELLLSNGRITNSSRSNTHEYYYNKFEELLLPIKKIMMDSNNNEMGRILNWLDAHVFSLRSIMNSDQREVEWSKIRGKLEALAKELQLSEGYAGKEVVELINPMRYLLLDYSSFILDQASDALDAKVDARDKAALPAADVLESDTEGDSTPSNNRLGV